MKASSSSSVGRETSCSWDRKRAGTMFDDASYRSTLLKLAIAGNWHTTSFPGGQVGKSSKYGCGPFLGLFQQHVVYPCMRFRTNLESGGGWNLCRMFISFSSPSKWMDLFVVESIVS